MQRAKLDEAGNMTDKIKDTAEQIMNDYPQVSYIHCAIIIISLRIIMASNVCQIVTFNLYGFNQGCSYLVELLKSNDIICVQEHWLSSIDFSKLTNLDNNFTVLCSSAMEDVLSKGPLRGRPFGGVAIFIRNSIIKKLKVIGIRERSIIVQINNMLLLNVYMPCNDPDIFADVLGGISDILANIDRSVLHTVLAGDFNCSPVDGSTIGNLLNTFLCELTCVAL